MVSRGDGLLRYLAGRGGGGVDRGGAKIGNTSTLFSDWLFSCVFFFFLPVSRVAFNGKIWCWQNLVLAKDKQDTALLFSLLQTSDGAGRVCLHTATLLLDIGRIEKFSCSSSVAICFWFFYRSWVKLFAGFVCFGSLVLFFFISSFNAVGLGWGRNHPGVVFFIFSK